MFSKALVIASCAAMASAVKLQATVSLSSLAGVNIKALSTEELAQLKLATRDQYQQYAASFNKSVMTEAESEARHTEWLGTRSKVEQYMLDDPSYHADGTEFDDWTSEEKESLQGTQALQALPENDRTPVQGKFVEESSLLAKDDLWNTVYPGCTYTYQWIYDNAVQTNTEWGCNAFLNWDEHWLEQVGYRAYYDYYVVPGYCSDDYLRSWWNQNIVSWRDYLRDYLQCADDSQYEEEEEEQNDNSDNNQDQNTNGNCSSVSDATCIWGDEFVVPIKNQGSCGSCYAFSTTQILETYAAIATNQLVSLSEQQIVDCGYGGSHGCNGGWPASVLNEVSNAEYALNPEEDYEYKARVETCNVNKGASKKIQTVGNSVRVESHSVSAVKKALLNGPLAITVDANDKFMAYSGGVLRNCVYGQLNHAVNAVGWTQMDGVEVLKVRNSWGTWWGDAGYVYVAIDEQAAAENNGIGPCGILEHIYWADADFTYA